MIISIQFLIFTTHLWTTTPQSGLQQNRQYSKELLTMKDPNYPLIFFVESNSVYSKLVLNHLHSHKFQNVECFSTGEDCLKNIRRKPDIIVLDYLLSGINGLETMLAAKKKYPETDFIFLSAQDSIEIAIRCMRYGAFDYLLKDQHSLTRLTDKINKALNHRSLINSNKRFKRGIILFSLALALIILVFAILAIIYPTTFKII